MAWSWFPLRGMLDQVARGRRIAEVLFRNGLGFLAESAGLVRYLPPWRTRQMRADSQATMLTIPQRVRRTLEDLGPTYIKLGQIFSTRPDILPAEYISEFSKLLDAAPAVPVESIVETIEAELQRGLASCFASFDPSPIASASIGQVHRATLLDGTEVVVKVQRPGSERTIRADLGLLLAQARFLEARSDTLRTYGLTALLTEFAQALRDELDYTAEGRNADSLRELIADQDVVIPVVYWELTTQRVITLSALPGIKLSERQALEACGYDLEQIVERIVQVYLTQVFVLGMFHADPHPANILVADGQIGLVDFGTVGYLTPRIRENLGDLLFALVEQDADEIIHAIVRMGATEHALNLDALRRDVQRLVVRYYRASLEALPIAQFLGEVMALAFKHRIRLPVDLALLARTTVVLEGVAQSLDPSFVMSKQLEPFVTRLVRERLSIRRSLVEAGSLLRDTEALVKEFPRRVDSISEQIERGDLTLGVDVRRLAEALSKLDAIANRLSFSIIVAAIIIGSALILMGGEQAAIWHFPILHIPIPIGQIGFILAGLLGAWLLFSIIRSKGL